MAVGGYRRSRALWDEARRPDASKMATLRAILYELQPIRFSSIDTARWQARGLTLFRGTARLLTQTIPVMYHIVFRFVWNQSIKHWRMIGAILLYYAGVRTIHAYLDAGPLIMILTALGAIFTIGLGDDHDNPDRISAYSVFNRGFQRLLGSVDAEDLVNQHVGGGMMMGVGGGGDAAVPDRRRNERQRRGQRPINRNQQERQHQEPQQPRELVNNGGRENNNDPTNNIARKSGKKARRRDLQLRRDLQEQRRVAAEMGFRDAGDNLIMQQLIEEQLAAAEQLLNNHDDDAE